MHPAAADLSDILAQHWAVRWDLRGREPHTVEALPHPAVQLVVEGGRCRVHGVLRGRYSHTLDGRGDIFGTTFRPAGFRSLFGRPVAELTDRSSRARRSSAPPLASCGPDPRRPRRRRTDPDRGGLRSWAVARCCPARGRTVNGLVDATLADRAILKVDDHRRPAQDWQAEPAEALCFAEYVGVTPKWVIRRYRLHEAAERLHTAATDQSTLAHELGYADQAHFARDFKAAVGRPPASYVRS